MQHGYLLCDDLMWMSRVMAEARELGLKIVPARTVKQLMNAIDSNGVRSVILDLAQAEIGHDPSSVIEQLKSAGVKRLIAYGSHIETDLLQAAKEAGCDPVLSRSRMAAQLRALLTEWLA